MEIYRVRPTNKCTCVWLDFDATRDIRHGHWDNAVLDGEWDSVRSKVVTAKRVSYYRNPSHFAYVPNSSFLTLAPRLAQEHPEFHQRIIDSAADTFPIHSEHGIFTLIKLSSADSCVLPRKSLKGGPSYDPYTHLVLSAKRIPPFGLFYLFKYSYVQRYAVDTGSPDSFYAYCKKHRLTGITFGQTKEHSFFVQQTIEITA